MIVRNWFHLFIDKDAAEFTSPCDRKFRIRAAPGREEESAVCQVFSKVFNLGLGERYTHSYTRNSDTRFTVMGLTVPVIVQETPVTTKTTYAGREFVVVPAGTFEACRFSDEVTTPGGTAVTTTWLGVGNGLVIRTEESNGKISELVSASINGVPVQ